jgi:hypothetical protein
MQKCQLSFSSSPVCLCTWHSFTVLLTGLWRPFSEVSLDSCSLLIVACDVHVHFLLSNSNVEEIKFWVNWTVCQRNFIAAKFLMESQNCSHLVTGTLTGTKNLNYWDSCELSTVNPTKCLSCHKQVSRLEKILHSLATRMARTAESWRNISCCERKHCECFVLVCTDKNFISICQLSWPKKLIFCDTLLFVCIIHVGSFLHLGVHIITVWYIM